MNDFTCSINDFDFRKSVKCDPKPKPEPGVYVWRVKGTDRCVRIGKSNSNVIQRALEHVNGVYPEGYTYRIMRDYFENNHLELDVYVLLEKEKKYRILALEDYLEKTRNPIIRSGIHKPQKFILQKAKEEIEQNLSQKSGNEIQLS